MPIKIQFMLNNNVYLQKFLRENSYYYKELIRNPDFINEMNSLMKERYKMTLPDKLDKIKDNITMLNAFMDVLK